MRPRVFGVAAVFRSLRAEQPTVARAEGVAALFRGVAVAVRDARRVGADRAAEGERGDAIAEGPLAAVSCLFGVGHGAAQRWDDRRAALRHAPVPAHFRAFELPKPTRVRPGVEAEHRDARAGADVRAERVSGGPVGTGGSRARLTVPDAQRAERD